MKHKRLRLIGTATLVVGLSGWALHSWRDQNAKISPKDSATASAAMGSEPESFADWQKYLFQTEKSEEKKREEFEKSRQPGETAVAPLIREYSFLSRRLIRSYAEEVRLKALRQNSALVREALPLLKTSISNPLRIQIAQLIEEALNEKASARGQVARVEVVRLLTKDKGLPLADQMDLFGSLSSADPARAREVLAQAPSESQARAWRRAFAQVAARNKITTP